MHTRFMLPRLSLSQLLSLVVLMGAFALPATAQEPQRAINSLLDNFHQAAADADLDRYLGYFTQDGVFMGTDDWERWPRPAFDEYVAERFAGGTGWTYVPEQRFIQLAPDEQIAWFDEIAVSERWGRFRGTGVLLKVDNIWKIAHYSLTALVPNERFADVAKVTTEGFKARSAAPLAGDN
ncbi:MAG: nuclear transport factor 2 family protein [Congregibacter sp.]|nr:nuclear transport factor 2 family protein [Congregibacter sp.]